MSPTIFIIAAMSLYFCYELSGEVSGESPLVLRRAQIFSFYFMGEPLFATLKQKRVLFATRQ
jgi:uncharacterized membrane protein SpoIIM required for sporulation